MLQRFLGHLQTSRATHAQQLMAADLVCETPKERANQIYLLKHRRDITQWLPAFAVFRCGAVFTWLGGSCLGGIVVLRKPLPSLPAFLLCKLQSVWVQVFLVFHWDCPLVANGLVSCRAMCCSFALDLVLHDEESLRCEALGAIQQGSLHLSAECW